MQRLIDKKYCLFNMLWSDQIIFLGDSDKNGIWKSYPSTDGHADQEDFIQTASYNLQTKSLITGEMKKYSCSLWFPL